jgi:thymidylate kinase
MIKYLKELFDELNKEDINYAVLRGYETLPYEVSHDIDFGVKADELQKMKLILNDVSVKHNYIKVFEANKKDMHQIYFYSVENGICLKLDLWTNFTYKGLEYINLNDIISQVKYHNDIKVLNDNIEVLLSFLKEFLHNGWIRKDKLKILQSKLSDCGMYHKADKFINADEISRFSEYIDTGKMELQQEAKLFKKQLLRANISKKGFLGVAKEVFDYLSKYTKDFFRKKSFFVVLIGPDGSGKTTLSKMLLDEVEAKTSCFSRSYYIHGRFGFLPNLGRLVGKNREDTKKISFDQVEQSSDAKLYSKNKIIIYMTYYLFDYIFGSLILFKKRFSNTIIVADRYFYDYFYQSSFKKYPKFMMSMYGIFAPKPDLLIYLKANPEDIFNRKPELSIELLKEQQKSMESIFDNKNIFKKFMVVNTSEKLETTFLNIKKEILQ